MLHEKIQQLLFLKSEPALSPAEQEEIDDHLSTCETCRSDWEIWERLKTELALPPTTARNPDIFIAKVMARISDLENPQESGWHGAWWKIPTLAFGSLLILALGPRTEETTVTADSLLLNGNSSEQAQQLLHQSNVNTDEFFNLLLEDTRP